MANCMTCRHNDKNARYCSLKKAHTDLGYVLNCVAWEATDEAEMMKLRTENNKLRTKNNMLWELAVALADCRNTSCDDCVRWDYSQGGCTLDCVMREFGIEVPE